MSLVSGNQHKTKCIQGWKVKAEKTKENSRQEQEESNVESK